MGNATVKRELDTLLLHQIDAAYSFARWALGHPTIAESVIADLMAGELRTQAAHSYTSARAWILREVRCVALRQHGRNAVSTRHRAHTFADLIVPAQALSSIGARAAGFELQQSSIDMLRRGVADLSLEQREIVLFRDTQGLSYREIVALTGLPRSTVLSRLSQARDVLQSCLSTDAGTNSGVPELRQSLTSEHEEAPALIDAYIDAEVDISTAATFVQHIARCRGCAERLLTRSKLVQQIRSVTACRAPDSLRKRIQSRL